MLFHKLPFFDIRSLATCAALGLAAGALPATMAAADEVTDALDSARTAWEEGDVSYAIDELDYARQKMMESRTDALVAWLPEPPDGWTLDVDTEMSASMAMMGGGVGAEATYEGPDGHITMTLIADNPMVASLGAMVGNAAMLGHKIERVGREKFMVDEEGGSVQGVIDNRILIQAEGQETAPMLELIGTMDLKGLSDFGR